MLLDNHILKEILKVLERSECRLAAIERELHELRPVRFTLNIHRIDQHGRKLEMAAIIEGQSNGFVVTATASDNSTPVLSNVAWTASDPTVTITPVASDTTGATVTVSVPASVTQTSFTLDVTAQVSSNTSTTPQAVQAAPLTVMITPSTTPVSFTLTISELPAASASVVK